MKQLSDNCLSITIRTSFTWSICSSMWCHGSAWDRIQRSSRPWKYISSCVSSFCFPPLANLSCLCFSQSLLPSTCSVRSQPTISGLARKIILLYSFFSHRSLSLLMRWRERERERHHTCIYVWVAVVAALWSLWDASGETQCKHSMSNEIMTEI